MFECPSCAIEIGGRRSDYDRCPYCGYEFPRNRTGFVAVGLLLILLMLFFALYSGP